MNNIDTTEIERIAQTFGISFSESNIDENSYDIGFLTVWLDDNDRWIVTVFDEDGDDTDLALFSKHLFNRACHYAMEKTLVESLNNAFLNLAEDEYEKSVQEYWKSVDKQ